MQNQLTPKAAELAEYLRAHSGSTLYTDFLRPVVSAPDTDTRIYPSYDTLHELTVIGAKAAGGVAPSPAPETLAVDKELWEAVQKPIKMAYEHSMRFGVNSIGGMFHIAAVVDDLDAVGLITTAFNEALEAHAATHLTPAPVAPPTLDEAATVFRQLVSNHRLDEIKEKSEDFLSRYDATRGEGGGEG